MLTRIISGAILILVVTAVLLLNSVNPIITIGFLAVLAAVSVFEILNNTNIIKNKRIISIAVIYAFVATLLYHYAILFVFTASVFYVLTVAIFALICHKSFKHFEIAAAIAFPIAIAYSFNSVYTVFNTFGVPFLLLVLNFSSVCDTGAYCTGVTIGKHKLCPEISPKKTVEGAIGGIALSLIVTVIIVLIFNLEKFMLLFLLITPILGVVGMVGDLFASVIKRSVEIKDYGKLIPGHGGILDRFDSILLIAPVFVEVLKIMAVF